MFGKCNLVDIGADVICYY